jgi:hypothetical protein
VLEVAEDIAVALDADDFLGSAAGALDADGADAREEIEDARVLEPAVQHGEHGLLHARRHRPRAVFAIGGEKLSRAVLA